MPLLHMICLANSRKLKGRCIAGVRTDGKGWVRPVTLHDYGALSPAECTLDDGSEPQMLDLIEVDLAEPRPEPRQPENWLLGRRSWRLIARPAPDELRPLLRPCLVRGPLLFGDESDRIPYATFRWAPAPASLAFVAPKYVQWRITVDLYHPAKLKVRACFTLGGAQYDLALTDPRCEQQLAGLPPGLYPFSAAGFAHDDWPLLTISLGEPFGADQCCYKLVAGVTAVPRAWRS